MKTVLMVIAPDHFRDEEYAEPKTVLESSGAEVVTASTRAGACTGKLGMVVTADVALYDVEPAGLDALIFVGGRGAEVFFDDAVAHALAAAVIDEGGVAGAICIASSTLAHAGVLKGLRATAFPSEEDDLRSHGAVWTGADVEVDGQVVTACGPEAASAFGEAIADLLGLPRTGDE